MNKILIILGIILIAIVICVISDYVNEKYDKEKATEIEVFIFFFPIVIGLIYLFLCIMEVK